MHHTLICQHDLYGMLGAYKRSPAQPFEEYSCLVRVECEPQDNGGDLHKRLVVILKVLGTCVCLLDSRVRLNRAQVLDSAKQHVGVLQSLPDYTGA